MDNFFAYFNIAGFMYYDGVDVFNNLKVGTELKLVAEPDNKHDEYAVAIYYKDSKLGFIPRGENKQIAKLLHFGYKNVFSVKINRITPDEHPNNQIGVVAKIKKKK